MNQKKKITPPKQKPKTHHTALNQTKTLHHTDLPIKSMQGIQNKSLLILKMNSYGGLEATQDVLSWYLRVGAEHNSIK